MEITRIRCPRTPNPRDFSAQAHLASHLLTRTNPPYPAEAIAQAVQGAVILDVAVDNEGVVESVTLRSGHPLLAEAALQTVRAWKYRPTTVNGQPVAVVTDILVTFTLPNTVAVS
jgi:protein TonB